MEPADASSLIIFSLLCPIEPNDSASEPDSHSDWSLSEDMYLYGVGASSIFCLHKSIFVSATFLNNCKYKHMKNNKLN